jgi:NADPH:quinone reductase-like Zn-dependent oxidoreductase/ubiquinone/menaquinone biosynthesis C-methylase UbiE
MCIVRLLASWDIQPVAVVSHSSGEVSAAFAAGALTFQEALGIVYLRGTLAEKYQDTSVNRGAMMAAGLSAQDAIKYAERLTKGKAVVACVNSPDSVTLSGDSDAIEELEGHLQTDGIFARRLKVNAAYHSHHMLPMADEYRQCLEQLLTPKTSWSGIAYASPVTGELVQRVQTLGPDHWVQNLTQPVLFSTALESICVSSGRELQVDVLLEIGPHGALAGPIRQNLSALLLEDQSISYCSCLTRKENAVQTIQDAVCGLFSKGYPVDLAAVNMTASEIDLKVISGLPAYPWNHATKYWKESRINQEHRNRTQGLDELLGRSILGGNPERLSWRHLLRIADLPWLRDHCVQSDIVFPAAGILSMAVQAMQQVTDRLGHAVEGYKIRNVDIMNALVVPDTAEGIEVQLSLSPCSTTQLDDKDWWDFDLYSVTAVTGSWTKHCSGSISFVSTGSLSGSPHEVASTKSQSPSSSDVLQNHEQTETVDPAGLFAGLRSRGIFHGPLFQNLVDIRNAGDHSISTFGIRRPTRAKYVIHPTTLDSVFLAAYASLGNDAHGNSAVLPRSVDQIFISHAMAEYDEGRKLTAHTTVDRRDKRGFRSSTKVSSLDIAPSVPLIEVRGLYCQAIASMVAPQDTSVAPSTCFKTTWNLDWTLMPSAQLASSLQFPPDLQEVKVGEKLVQATFYFIHDTLASLSEAEIDQLDWHQRLFLQWMQTQHHLGLTGRLASDSSLWSDSDASSKQQLYAEVCKESVNGKLVCRVGHSLLDILRHKTTPLELMMHGNLLFDFYEQAIRCHRSYAQVKQLVAHFAHKTPRGRILEIGGGTGGCTTSVLEALSGDTADGDHRFARYDFTDISSGFFEKAATKFNRWSDHMAFKKLDIECEPSGQGFELESYDLVVACQVLHATKNMQRTMSHVRQLLKPGGKLLMVETTRDTPDMQLIFGTLPGWWLGEGRNESPNMPVESWREILTATRFNGLDFEVGDCDDSEHYSFSTMLATASSPEPRYPEELSIIVPPGVPRPWLEKLKASITRATGMPTIEEDLATAGLKNKYHVYLLELEKPLLSHLDSDTFSALRRTLTSSPGGLWVTSGGLIDGMDPDYALHVGLLRTLRLEDATKRLASFDLPRQDSPWTTESCQMITEVVLSTFDLNLTTDSMDCEYATRGSNICVARIFENGDANNAAAALSNATQTGLEKFVGSSKPLRINVGATGNLDSIRFVEDKTMYAPLNGGYIEVEPKAFGVNFRDVLVALGHIDGTTLGFECSGVVTGLGPDTEQSGLQVGDRVCAIMQGHFGRPVRLHWTWAGRIPDETSFEEAASIPMAFITAYQSLFESARLEQGETILIHAAAGAVGQAAIMLAQNRKAEIFVTVGTDVKRAFMMETYGIPADHIASSRDTSFASMIMTKTGGKGVDVVLNSLSGPLLKASWDCIASFGRFIEIGKRDIEQNKVLDMAPLRRAASFAAVDLDHMTRLRGDLVVKAFREVLRLWACHSIKAVTPVKQFPMSDLVGAFRFMQSGKHLGKIVIVPEPGDLVKVSPSRPNWRLQSILM